MLPETAADIAAMIPRAAWELMDEEQRDDLMANVVLPRYMATTADGVTLGPTWWAEAVGATANAIRKRIERLRQSQIADDDTRTSTPAEQAARRHARRVLQREPETVAAVIPNAMADENVRAAILSSPAGVAAVQSMAREVEATHAARRPDVDPLPSPPAFARAFWRAVGVVDAAHDELERFGTQGMDVEPEAREAAERLRRKAGEISAAVVELAVENQMSERG